MATHILGVCPLEKRHLLEKLAGLGCADLSVIEPALVGLLIGSLPLAQL